MDEETEGLKKSVEIRQKELEDLRAENETLRMRQFELLDANYGLTKDTEEAMEVINEAKEISKILSVINLHPIKKYLPTFWMDDGLGLECLVLKERA